MRRSRFEVYLDVLQAVSNGACKHTLMMREANLSYNGLMKILVSLVGQGLLVAIEADIGDKRTRTLYKLSPKGKNIVRYYLREKPKIQNLSLRMRVQFTKSCSYRSRKIKLISSIRILVLN